MSTGVYRMDKPTSVQDDVVHARTTELTTMSRTALIAMLSSSPLSSTTISNLLGITVFEGPSSMRLLRVLPTGVYTICTDGHARTILLTEDL